MVGREKKRNNNNRNETVIRWLDSLVFFYLDFGYL